MTTDETVIKAAQAVREHSWTGRDVEDLSEKGLRAIIRVALAAAGHDEATESDGQPLHLPYRYFVSYAHARGFGHININRKRPVTTMAEVNAMTELIKDTARDSQVAIISFQRFPDA